MAYIIMKQHDNDMRTLRAKIKVITTDPRFINLMNDDLAMRANDFLEMYNEYSKKIIVNGETVKYTGSMESDVFKGSYGNKVKGIVNLRIFGMKITKDATRLLKK